MKVKITKPALARLMAIHEYHKKEGNISKGIAIQKKIVQMTQLLGDNPLLGKKEKQLVDMGLGHRSLVIDRHYKVIYRIGKVDLYITDIFDVRQDPEKMKPD
jgi:plasmid stabilization system protein ParE